MSFADDMRILSDITCGLASVGTYVSQRKNGATVGSAGLSLFDNLLNGFVRNEVAYDMQRFGNPFGNAVNMFAGYGNPISNTVGTLGLMSANCSPWMFFGGMSMCSPMGCCMPMMWF